MSNTRDFISLGVVAKNATPVDNDSDPERVAGDTYRKTDVTEFQEEEGELYNVPPSTEFINQKTYNQSSFTDIINKNGIVGWSKQIDYAPPAVVWGSDNKFYTCKAPSGPSTKIVDPISDNQSKPLYWIVLDNAGLLREQLAVETAPNEGDRRVGYTGISVQTALDNAFSAIHGLDKFKILFSANVYLFPYGEGIRDYIFYTQAYNIASVIPIVNDPEVEGYIHGMEVVFQNPLDDANYMSLIMTSWLIDNTYSPSVMPYMYDKTTTGLKCGYNFIDNRLGHKKGNNYKDYLFAGDPTSPVGSTRAEGYFTNVIGYIIP